MHEAWSYCQAARLVAKRKTNKFGAICTKKLK